MGEAEVKNGSRIQQRYRMKQKLGAAEKKSRAASSGIGRRDQERQWTKNGSSGIG
jgi:hypothetical protein